MGRNINAEGESTSFKNWFALLIILFLSWWAIRSLFHRGFFPMHDDEQIARLFELHQALSTGQFPPRWVPNLGFGYGYPFYNFYPPFVYYLGEIFYLLGFSLITSTKIVMILGFLLSGVFMYLLAKAFFGQIGGIVSAIFYIYAPYYALDLYVRGALAECYSFVFIPAVFWSSLNLAKKKNKKWLIINSLFLSLLLLSHNLITLIFLFFYFLYLAFLIFFEKEKKRALVFFSLSFLLFLGLTCYFWLPALAEKKYTLVDEILTRELASYKLHFVYLRQLLNSPWGYGGSIFGLEDGISFEVGKLHLILSALAGIFGLFLLGKRKREGRLFTFHFSLFTFSLFMTSFHSQFIWDRLKPLWYLQFPWRFLVFAAFFSSLLSGGIIDFIIAWQKTLAFMPGMNAKSDYTLPRRERRKLESVGFSARAHVNLKRKPRLFKPGKFICKTLENRLIAKLIVISVPVFFVIFLNNGYFKPARYLDVSDRDYTNEEDLKWRVSKMSFEYIPKGVATKLSDIGTTQLDLEKEGIAKTSFEIIEGPLNVIEIKDLPHKKIFKTRGEGKLRVNIFNFPGWRAFVDGKEIVIEETGKLKLITLRVPEGEHRIEVVFTNTLVRSLADLISLVSVLISFFGLLC